MAKKFGALSENVKGRKLILIDDSIVRGNTIGPIIKLLRDAGAKEVSYMYHIFMYVHYIKEQFIFRYMFIGSH